jgi:hypothetical protein
MDRDAFVAMMIEELKRQEDSGSLFAAPVPPSAADVLRKVRRQS